MKILQLFFYLSRFQQQLDRMEIKMGQIDDLKADLQFIRDQSVTIRQLAEERGPVGGTSSPEQPATGVNVAQQDLDAIQGFVNDTKEANKKTLEALEAPAPDSPGGNPQLPNEPDPGPIESTD